MKIINDLSLKWIHIVDFQIYFDNRWKEKRRGSGIPIIELSMAYPQTISENMITPKVERPFRTAYMLHFFMGFIGFMCHINFTFEICKKKR